MLSLVLSNAAWLVLLVSALWVVSVFLRDVSIIDPWWSIGQLIVLARTVFVTGASRAKVLMVGMVGVWAIRLFVHLLQRSIGKAEDPRYTAFREKFGAKRYVWVSYFQVFLLQAFLMLVVSAPLFVAGAAPVDESIRWNDWAGAAVCVIGFTIEAVADAQLAAFRKDASKKGSVLDSGLFRLSRHPNYFGETLFAWGAWIMAADAPYGLATVFAPIVMTWLLVRVSGVSLLDEHMLRTKQGYADYMRRTSSFVPWPPSE